MKSVANMLDEPADVTTEPTLTTSEITVSECVMPYFAAMASDLRYCGYKRIDVARIYGFNLILLPVNLAGTVSSLVQGITASKSAFARTPKVRDRTVAPPFFVIAPYLMIALAGYTFYSAYLHDRVENMSYAALNIILAVYATVAFIGIRNSIVDGWIHFTINAKRAISAEQAARYPQFPDNWFATATIL